MEVQTIDAEQVNQFIMRLKIGMPCIRILEAYRCSTYLSMAFTVQLVQETGCSGEMERLLQ